MSQKNRKRRSNLHKWHIKNYQILLFFWFFFRSQSRNHSNISHLKREQTNHRLWPGRAKNSIFNRLFHRIEFWNWKFWFGAFIMFGQNIKLIIYWERFVRHVVWHRLSFNNPFFQRSRFFFSMLKMIKWIEQEKKVETIHRHDDDVCVYTFFLHMHIELRMQKRFSARQSTIDMLNNNCKYLWHFQSYCE